MRNIIILEENIAGQILKTNSFDIHSESITIKDLIKNMVNQEVLIFNKNSRNNTMYGYNHLASDISKSKNIDAEQEYFLALDAFQKNGFFIIVDDKQVESIDEEIYISENTKISFIKITQLVGG